MNTQRDVRQLVALIGTSVLFVCSPSRYTLLTGRYHWRTKLQSGIVSESGAPVITPERLTIASLAKQHGYRSARFGKWHLGWNWAMTAEQLPFVFGSESTGDMYDESLEGRAKKKKLVADWAKLTDSDPAPIPTEKALDAWLSILHGIGVQAERHGDSTGVLKEIVA